MSRGMPTSPFEIEATKDILARRIENGDIQQSDLDLLKKGYRWMTTASFLGSIGMAIPTYLFLRRKQPPVGMGVKLLAGGGMGMLGSFLGFTVGGAAAAAEVNRSMENPQQKLKVFQEIATEARRASIERAGGIAPGRPLPASGSRQQPRESIGVETSPSTWSSESALDRSELSAESARESTYSRDMSDISRDSGFARRPTGGDMALPQPMGNERAGMEDGQKRSGEGEQDSWAQLRRGGAFPSAGEAGQRGMGIEGKGQQRENERLGSVEAIRSGAPSRNQGMDMGQGRKEAEKTAEQREFDALLERERAGVAGDDKWA